jgi:hypothetical protein
MIKALRRLFYQRFKRYRRLELRFIDYREADYLIKQGGWILAKEEDTNKQLGMVYLERRGRILE